MAVLEGVLADRDAWSAVGNCSIEKTMELLGTKSAMLIMREASYGTTRFDDFAKRVGITKAAASTRLSELVAAGLLRLEHLDGGAEATVEIVCGEGHSVPPGELGVRLVKRKRAARR